MRKILFVILLTITSMTYAEDEGRYNMLADVGSTGKVVGIYILDTKDGKVKYCLFPSPHKDTEVACTEWTTNNI